MELLMLVVGIVLLWKFSSSLNGMATSARAKTEVVAERVVSEAVQERSANFEEHLRKMEGKKTYSHSEIMAHYRVNE